ncbi:MAG: hypothetical protein ABSB40_05890 [Nitrososphaeria archaeon]|jgi:hypothetical protein
MTLKGVEDILFDIYIRLPFLEGISYTKNVDRKEALKLIQRYRSEFTGSDNREVFRTSDSIQLLKDILKLVTPYCGNKVTEDRILTLTPFSNAGKLNERISFLNNIFTTLKSNKEISSLARDVIKNVKLVTVKPPLNSSIAVSSEELRQSLSSISKGLHVDVVSKKDIAELSKGKDLLICVGFGEVKDCISLQGSFEFFELVPDRFIGIFESFKTVLEAYQTIGRMFKEKELELYGLFSNVEDASNMLNLLGNMKLDRVDPRSTIEEGELEINEGIESMMKSNSDSREYKSLISDVIGRLGSKLGLDEKRLSTLVRDALENARTPFYFSTYMVNQIVEGLEKSKAKASFMEYLRVSRDLSKYLDMLGEIAEELYEFDLILSIFNFKEEYHLSFAKTVEEGIGFIGGRNIFLIQDELKGQVKIQNVDYSIGRTDLEIFGANTSKVVLLTGANSGGKTTLLTTVAQVATMSMLGLPVPAYKAESPIISIYLFRRRTVRKIGSLEHALKSTIPILSRRERKLILMDEFEALTEPKAIARIVAVFLNNLPKQSLALFVTHLAGDTIPYLKTEFRVDGIEATGIDEEGNLIVDRQPTFNRLGTSSPELIVEKLQKTTRSKRVFKTYEEMLDLLRHLRGGRSSK